MNLFNIDENKNESNLSKALRKANILPSDLCHDFDTLLLIKNIYFLCSEQGKSISSLEKELKVSAGYISRIENSTKNADPENKAWIPTAAFVFALSEILKIYIDILVNLDLSATTKSEYDLIRLFTSLAKSTYDDKLDWKIIDLPSVNYDEIVSSNIENLLIHKCTAPLPNSSSCITIELDQESMSYFIYLTATSGNKQIIYKANTYNQNINYAYEILIRAVNTYFNLCFIKSSYIKDIMNFSTVVEGIRESDRHSIKQAQNSSNNITFNKRLFFDNISNYMLDNHYKIYQAEKAIGVSKGFISRILKDSYKGEPNFNIVYRASLLLSKDLYYLNYIKPDITLYEPECLLYDFTFRLCYCKKLLWKVDKLENDYSLFITKLPDSNIEIIIKYSYSSENAEVYIKDEKEESYYPIAYSKKTFSQTGLSFSFECIKNKVTENLSDISMEEVSSFLSQNDGQDLDNIISSLW